jgi:hypothetical protein
MRNFKGKLAVAGSSYTGVALNDCVRGARELVAAAGSGGVTGLERFLEPFEQRWVVKRSFNMWQRWRLAMGWPVKGHRLKVTDDDLRGGKDRDRNERDGR